MYSRAHLWILSAAVPSMIKALNVSTRLGNVKVVPYFIVLCDRRKMTETTGIPGKFQSKCTDSVVCTDTQSVCVVTADVCAVSGGSGLFAVRGLKSVGFDSDVRVSFVLNLKAGWWEGDISWRETTDSHKNKTHSTLLSVWTAHILTDNTTTYCLDILTVDAHVVLFVLCWCLCRWMC